ncbi:MAG: ABC transporter permease, partial [Acidobacteria bacterium]|nr:ABC transporter permease [Acidobacteriota bacterium]
MSSFLHDIRYGLRMLIKNPGFTLVAVLTLALGIGANTTIFTLINAVFLHPIAVTDPERVISVFTTDEKNRGPFSNFAPMSQLNFRDYRDSNDVFSGLVLTTFSSISLSGTGDPEQVFGQVVTGNYFDVLGVKPAIGRTFLPEEDSKLGAYPVTVLSNALWKRRYGGDTTLVGKTIKLNGLPHTVIGVMPPAFHGENAFGGPAMWIPMAMRETFLTGVFAQYFEERRALLFGVFGRLKPGVSLQQAESSMKTIASRLEKEFPRENEKRSVALVPLPQSIINPNIRNNFVQAGTLLMTIVGLVLLIACANLANLLLVRAAGRQREMAVRLSLGAGRARIVRQLLTESVLLSIAGCGVGMLFATWGRDVLWSNRPPFFGANGAAGFDLSLDWRVLTFTAGISVLTAILFGLIPALQATRTNLNETLKEGGRAGSGGSRIRLRSVLVVGEVALALVSLIGSGLFLRSLDQAQKIDPGFETKKMMVLSFDLGAQRYTEEQSREFWKRTSERLKGLPMVRAAAVAANAPFAGGFQRTVFRDGADTSDRRGGKLMLTNPVMPGYFEATGIPLLRGRDFTLADTAESQMVAVVNETLARTLWPGEEPLGKRFKFYGETWTPIVIGVA